MCCNYISFFFRDLIEEINRTKQIILDCCFGEIYNDNNLESSNYIELPQNDVELHELSVKNEYKIIIETNTPDMLVIGSLSEITTESNDTNLIYRKNNKPLELKPELPEINNIIIPRTPKKINDEIISPLSDNEFEIIEKFD